MIIPYYKPIGKTSFSAILEFKKKFKGEKIGYVGTLDPMAEGLLLILTGTDTKRCQELTNLKKEYEFEVVFGLATDSGDVLGLVEEGGGVNKGYRGNKGDIEKKALEKVLAHFVGEYLQTVPAFSSVKVAGKKLHEVSRSKKLPKPALPKRSVNIYKTTLKNFYCVPYPTLRIGIFKRLNTLEGAGKYFRKDEVVKRWEEWFDLDLSNFKNFKLPVAKIKVTVSKGTYIRSLAEDIAKKLNTCGMCLSICRTKYSPMPKGLAWESK